MAILSQAEELINKAKGRNNLTRQEQRQMGLLLQDKMKLCSFQAQSIRELREEIIRLKLSNK